MRRLGMMVVALMMVATMSFAQKVSDSKSMSFDKLSRYLQLDANQIAEVSEINTYFENQLGQPCLRKRFAITQDRKKLATHCCVI